MKETYYFPHDYHARHDPKLERLRIEMGPVSDGIFWNLVEMLYEQGGYLQLKDVPIYSKMLNADEQVLNKVIDELFVKDGDRFYNRSLLDRLTHINHVKEERRAAGIASGKSRETNKCSTNDEQLRNTIKESKVKESKVKESNIINDSDKDKTEHDHSFSFEDFWNLYPKKVGMSMALITFRATVKTKQDFEDLKTALKNYTASEEFKKGFIKNGDNWIEDWRGWIRMTPKSMIRRQSEPIPVKPKDVFQGGAKEDIERIFKHT